MDTNLMKECIWEVENDLWPSFGKVIFYNLRRSINIYLNEKDGADTLLSDRTWMFKICGLLLYALFNHHHLLIQVACAQKAQFPHRLDWLVP